MIRTAWTAVTLAALLAGPAFADDDRRGRDRDRDDRREHRDDRRDDDWRRGDRDRDYWHERVRRHDDVRHDKRRYDKKRYDHRGYERHRRHLPPARYRADYGYRSGYDLAWRDWVRYGRHDRRWRRSYWNGSNHGYRSGYEAGWRDAARYYGAGYRPRYWARDPRGGWFFGFNLDG
jgi:hypothetical protein